MTLDYYGASVNCWIAFLNVFLTQAINQVPANRPSIWGDISSDQSLQWGHDQLISNIAAALKFHTSAIDMTSKAIRSSALNPKLHDAYKVRIEQVLFRAECLCLSFNLLVERVQIHFDLQRTRAEKQMNMRQEASLRLLAWITCIFLPLSTAASLLSMGNRAKDIGAVWWDWLGISFITGVGLLLGLTWTMKSYLLGRSFIFIKLRTIFLKAKKTTLRRHGINHLVHPGVRFLLRLGVYAFFVGAVVAFLIGMFVGLETGVRILWLSLAGALGLVLLPLLVWRLIGSSLWLIKRILGNSLRSWRDSLHRRLLPYGEVWDIIVGLSVMFGILAVASGVLGLVFIPVLLLSLVTGGIIFELIYRIGSLLMKATDLKKLFKRVRKIFEDEFREDEENVGGEGGRVEGSINVEQGVGPEEMVIPESLESDPTTLEHVL